MDGSLRNLLLGVLLAWGLLTACSAPPLDDDRPQPSAFFLETGDGVALAVTDRGRTTVEGGGVTLVLLHGLACDQRSFDSLVGPLTRRYRVVSFDGAGHGATQGTRPKATVHSFGEDAAFVVERLDLERVVFVGHSMGGPVGLLATARVPDRVIGVIGLDTLHDLSWRMTPDLLEPVLGAFERDFDGTMENSIRSMYAADESTRGLERTLEVAKRTDHATVLKLMESFLDFRPGLAAEAADRPIRCVNAAASPTPTDVAGNRARAPRGYDAVLLDGVGHFLHLTHPDRTRAAVEVFLRELVGLEGTPAQAPPGQVPARAR